MVGGGEDTLDSRAKSNSAPLAVLPGRWLLPAPGQGQGVAIAFLFADIHGQDQLIDGTNDATGALNEDPAQ